MPRQITLPLLRVHALPDGQLTTDYREGPLRRVDEGWWDSVLSDPRASEPMRARFDANSPFAYLRLNRQPGEKLWFNCDCGKDEVVNKADMIKQMGDDYNVNWLAREYMPCDARNKLSNWCRARCLR